MILQWHFSSDTVYCSNIILKVKHHNSLYNLYICMIHASLTKTDNDFWVFLTDSSDISSIRTIDSNLFREQWSKTNIFYLHSLVCVTTSIRLTCFYTNWLCCHVCKNVYSFWAGENLHVLLYIYIYMDNVSIWSIWTPVSGSICLCLSRARTQVSIYLSLSFLCL